MSIATVKPDPMSSLVRLPIDAGAQFVVHYGFPRAPSARCLCAAKRRRSRYLPLKPRPRAGAVATLEVVAPRFPLS